MYLSNTQHFEAPTLAEKVLKSKSGLTLSTGIQVIGTFYVQNTTKGRASLWLNFGVKDSSEPTAREVRQIVITLTPKGQPGDPKVPNYVDLVDKLLGHEAFSEFAVMLIRERMQLPVALAEQLPLVI